MKNLCRIFAVFFLLSSCTYLSRRTDEDIKTPANSRKATLSRVSESAELTPSAPIKTETIKRKPAAKKSLPKPADGTRELSSVEILLQVPDDDIKRYYLHYGFEKNRLNRHIQISVSRLEKFIHPAHGPLTRFMLHGVPRGKSVYYTVQAENSQGRSPESPLQVVEAK